MKLRKTIGYMTIIGCLVLCSLSCKKLVEVDPPTNSINAENVFDVDETAIAVLTGQYTLMCTEGGGINFYTTFSGSLLANELDLSGEAYEDELKILRHTYTPNDIGAGSWGISYRKLYIINSVIEGLSRSTTLTAKVKSQLLGEAKFLRAYYYYYLINFYGDVPLALGTDYKENALLSRSPISAVYAQMEKDLLEATELLSTDFVGIDAMTKTTERVRPNKWAALSLLARIYLYQKKYGEAEQAASQVIAQNGLFEIVGLNDAFLANNREAVWQIQSVNNFNETWEAQQFIIQPNMKFTNYLSSHLYETFENDDLRKVNWIGTYLDQTVSPVKPYHFPYKYRIIEGLGAEYLTVFRLAEQYLIRAEARANLGKTSDAIADLDKIRERAGLEGYEGATDVAALVNAILHERQVELFTEFGHRWFDLKRTGKLDQVMTDLTPVIGAPWSPHKALLPVDFNEMRKNPNLRQTPGY